MKIHKKVLLFLLLIIIIEALFIGGGIYEYQKNEQPAGTSGSATAATTTATSLSAATSTISSSSVSGWNTYTNSDFGVSLNYPTSYGTPTLSDYGTIISFDKPSYRNDGSVDSMMSSSMSFGVGVHHDLKDGHLLSVSELMDNPSAQATTIDGKSGLTYSSSQIGAVTDIPLGNGEIFYTTLDPHNPTNKQIIDSIKFIPRNSRPDFKLHAWLSIATMATIAHPTDTTIAYSISGNDVDATVWNGKWTLKLDCPAGVTSFSYGAYMNCNASFNEPLWSTDTNPGGWLINSTNEVQQVRATAQLLDANGIVVATDQVTVNVPPSLSPTAFPSASAENGYTGIFSVASFGPVSAKVPFSVGFASTIQSGGAESIDFGDGSRCQKINYDNYDEETQCDILNHTYTKPGTYIVILYSHLPTTELARLTVTAY